MATISDDDLKKADLTRKWNYFVSLLERAEHVWEVSLRGADNREIQDLGLNGKALAMHRFAPFDVFLGKLIGRWRGQGGLETLKIPIQEHQDN